MEMLRGLGWWKVDGSGSGSESGREVGKQKVASSSSSRIPLYTCIYLLEYL
jgi:hypothetical protein